ncbi:MAG: DUF1566 domain-containing protein [Lewinella sp.]
MKRIILFIGALLLFAVAANAQTPEAFKYQAVARDAGGQILANQSVSLRIGILKGSVSGDNIYSEIHFKTTNAFGLVNLEIGRGDLMAGEFSAIDWGNDTYFVQIEMDETGGANYQVLGTSQLLSVPYAMHAKTAENVDDADADPTNELQSWSTLPGIPDDIADGDQVEDGDADPMNEIELPTGGINGQVLSTDGAGNYNWTNSGGNSATYSVGDFAQGGVVFWVDETGQHGLVCAIEDQSADGIKWHNETFLDTKAMRIGIYGGAINTERITDVQGSSSYAASICARYNGGNFGDWYLPTIGELRLMFENRITINTTTRANGGSDFARRGYWSSSEHDANSAALVFCLNFFNGTQAGTPKNFLTRVRAVRAF